MKISTWTFHLKHRKALRLFGASILLVSCMICSILFLGELITTRFWGWPYDGMRRKFVAQELKGTVMNLPQLQEAELLANGHWIASSHSQVPKRTQSDLRREGIPPCYYGTSVQILGSPLSEMKLTENYLDELSRLGYQNDLKGSSTLLYLGDNIMLNIRQATEWTSYYSELNFNYDEMSSRYKSLIIVQVKYAWPKLDGC